MSLRENLEQEAVAALRVLDPVEMEPDGTVADAIRLMREHGVGCVVLTEREKPIGIVTERDILTKVLAGDLPTSTRVAKVMTSPPEVIEEGCSVAAVMRRMHQGGFRHMPVVDPSGRLRGVISVKRIVEYLAEHFPSAVFNLPPEPVRGQVAREGA